MTATLIVCPTLPQSTSVTLQQTKLEKFNTLIAAADTAVGNVAQAVQSEMAAIISEACARIASLKTLLDR